MNDFRESVDQMSEAIKEHRWEEHMSKYGRGISMFRTNEVTELICKGIPNKLRSEIWMLMSGAIHERLANTGTVYILGQQALSYSLAVVHSNPSWLAWGRI